MSSSIFTSEISEIITPASLSPGDMYYLAFVTDGSRNATSTDISVYDQFVNDQADLNTDLNTISWKALGSTRGATDVDAIDHLGIGAFPVFLLDGTTLIADDGADLWDGDLDAALGIDQYGMLAQGGLRTNVWTGTAADGKAYSGGTLGSPFPDNPVVGDLTLSDSRWLVAGSSPPGGSLRVYAFSEKLTMPGAVIPEPSSLAIWAGLGLALLVSRRRRSRRR